MAQNVGYMPILGDLISQELKILTLPALKQMAIELRISASNMKKKQLQQDILRATINKLGTETLLIDPNFPGLFNLDVPILKDYPLLKVAVERYNEIVKRSHPGFSNGYANQAFIMAGLNIKNVNMCGGAAQANSNGVHPNPIPYLPCTTTTMALESERGGGCYCAGMIKPPIIKSPGILTCQVETCSRRVHADCLKINDRDLGKEQECFECPQCVLLKNDPLNEVVDTLLKPYLISHTMQNQQEFILDPSVLKKIYDCEEFGIEIKCLKLEGKYLSEHTWLDCGDLYFNGRKIMDFKPLQINSALKKRKDEKFFIRENLSTRNVIKFNDMKPNYDVKNNVRYDEHAVYMAGVFQVRKLKTSELIAKIQKICLKDE